MSHQNAYAFKSRPDSLMVLKLDSIAFRLFLSSPDSAITVARTALAYANESDFKYCEGFSYYILSKAYWAKANYKLSAEYGFKALKTFENSGYIRLWGESLLSLARTFIDLENLDQALIYIERSYRLGKLHHDELLIAAAFREKSMLLSEVDQYDSALYYTDAGITIYEKFSDTLNISILYGRKAKIYFRQGNYSESHFYNKRGLMLDSLIGNQRALGISYYQAALDAVHLNKTDSAIFFLKKSARINRAINNMATLIKVHHLLADLYLKKRKPDLAVVELKLASQYKDSLYNAEKNGQVQEMQSLYELSSKEHKIAELEHDNMVQLQQVKIQRLFVGLLLVGVVSLILIIIILQQYRNLQEKSNKELALKNKSIEQQKEEIQSQAETLHALNELKTKLFSVISHDLRGPMANLYALLDLLSHEQLTAEEFMSVSGKLKSSIGVTQRTMENLLNWSLSQMEGIKAQPVAIDIEETISEACSLMNEDAQRKNVRIEKEIDESLMVKADSDQLHLILRNLIHNAIKFSKPHNIISVSAYRDSNYCLVSVKDSGIGMTIAEIETVASSKHHFSKAGTMREKGTGLGLLLCKEFIKLNGGEITIRSNIDEGTEVIFTVPLAS